MSAPSSIGRWKYGDMKVLSTTTSTPCRWLNSRWREDRKAPSEDWSASPGKTSRVFFWNARSTVAEVGCIDVGECETKVGKDLI